MIFKIIMLFPHKQVAEDNMKNAAAELQHGTDEIVNTAISTDGTWQRRGFSSLDGVTIIDNSNGKCMDYRVKTKNCHACKLWKNKTGPKAEKFRKTHKCSLKVTTHLQTYFLKGLLYRKTNNGYLKEMISNFEF